jgi:hypothetical protein
MIGNQNSHVEITFNDNIKWLVGFRLPGTHLPLHKVRD